MEPIGFHPPPDLDPWRRRVQAAFAELIDSMTPGHGDPLPPDVPPSIRPGQWPDVPAHAIPAMTVRHQLTVLRTIAGNSRTNTAFPRHPADVAAWTLRVQKAYDALDHGASLTMPDSYRTAPPAAPPKKATAPKKATSPKKAPAPKKAAAHGKPTSKKAGPSRTSGKKPAPKKATSSRAKPKR